MGVNSYKSNKSESKKAFIEAYESRFGNISEACKIAGISRQTYYRWLKADADFKAAIDAIEPEEMAVDLAESKLIQRIKEGSDTCLIFFLKTKGKHRGYVEKIQTEDVTDKPKKYTLVRASDTDEQNG